MRKAYTPSDLERIIIKLRYLEIDGEPVFDKVEVHPNVGGVYVLVDTGRSIGTLAFFIEKVVASEEGEQ